MKLNSSPTKEVTFFQCPQCESHYTLHESGSLTDRWGMPLSLVLYGVIFDKKPINKAKHIAEQFSVRDDINLPFLVKNVKDELECPTQKVSEILEFSYPNEIALRSFLKVFCEELNRVIK